MIMKKKITAAVSVALAAVLLLAALQGLLVPKYTDNREGNLVGEYYSQAGENDVLLVGDCEVYESFSPPYLWQEYGITSFVRGSPQQLICQSYYLIEEMLKYEEPQTACRR